MSVASLAPAPAARPPRHRRRRPRRDARRRLHRVAASGGDDDDGGGVFGFLRRLVAPGDGDGDGDGDGGSSSAAGAFAGKEDRERAALRATALRGTTLERRKLLLAYDAETDGWNAGGARRGRRRIDLASSSYRYRRKIFSRC